MQQVIPKSSDQRFTEGIQHPNLFLWDAWSFYEDEVIHLYCLALERYTSDQVAIDATQRNQYPFHIRHFTSTDEGKSWTDAGVFLRPRSGEGRHDSRTVWSGSTEQLPDGRKLVAYTGLYEINAERCFLQNVSLAVSTDGYTVDKVAEEPLSCPSRDRAAILAMGYYLDEPQKLGHRDGENNGPILAWRDPFVFVDPQENIRLFWAAKTTSHHPVMAHALLEPQGKLFKIKKLLPPITLPDSAVYTQLELPKILYNPTDQWYYLIVATCNRLYEGQSDAEVGKAIRMYRSRSLAAGWEAWGMDGSILFQQEHLFGMTVLKPDFANQRLLCISPYTEAAAPKLSLTFSKTFYLYLDPVRVVW